MRSRMERYDLGNSGGKNYSRTDKNTSLYKDIGSNSKYTNFTDVSNINAYEINTSNPDYRTREGYHQIKEYNDFIKTPKVKRELDEFNYLYHDHENKVYDINTVLEEARKNRIDKDELEQKRKLKNTNYNILADLNPSEVKKYKDKKCKAQRASDEEIRELIDTITSKTLAGEISKSTGVDLLSDLMATNVMDKVGEFDSEDIDDTNHTSDIDLSISKEILDKEAIEKVNLSKLEPKKDSIMDNADSDFYTRSMDLSDKDFDMDDEFVDKKIPIVIKVILTLVLIAVLGIVVYFVLKMF